MKRYIVLLLSLIVFSYGFNDVNLSKSCGIVKKASIYENVDYFKIYNGFAFTTNGNYLNILDIHNPLHAKLTSYMIYIPFMKDLVVKNDIAYVLGYYGKLYLLDISNPYDSKIVKTINIAPNDNNFKSLTIKDNYIYAISSQKLYVIDISNSLNPTIIKTITLSQTLISLTLKDNTLYILKDKFSNDKKIITFDISDLSDPVDQSSLDIEEVTHLKFYGSYAYTDKGIYDFSKNPIESVSNITYSASDFLKKDDTLYILRRFASGSPIINVYNIADINHPKLIRELSGYGCIKLSNYGNFLFAAGNEGIGIYDISNPTFNNFISLGFYAKDFIKNSNLYYSIDNNHLKTYEANATDPKLSKATQIDSKSLDNPMSIKLYNNMLYIADGGDGIKEFSLNDSKKPTLLKTIQTDSSSIRVDVNDNYIYSLTSSSFDIYEKNSSVKITNATLYANSTFNDMKIADNKAFLCEEDGTIHIVDISNPNNLSFLANFNTNPYSCESIDVDNAHNCLFIAAANGGVYVYDITDMQNPKLTDILNYKNARNVSVDDGKLLVNHTYGIDIYALDALNVIGRYKLPENYNAKIYGNSLYLFNSNIGTLELDLNKTLSCYSDYKQSVKKIDIKPGWNLVSLGKFQPFFTKNILKQIPDNAIIWYYSLSKTKMGANYYYNGIWLGDSNMPSVKSKMQQLNIYTPDFIKKFHSFWLYNATASTIKLNPLQDSNIPPSIYANMLSDKYSYPLFLKGWNMVNGHGNDINATALLKRVKCKSTIWLYDNAKGWSALSNDVNTTNVLKDYNISVIDNILPYQGFWLYLDSDQNLSL